MPYSSLHSQDKEDGCDHRKDQAKDVDGQAELAQRKLARRVAVRFENGPTSEDHHRDWHSVRDLNEHNTIGKRFESG